MSSYDTLEPLATLDLSTVTGGVVGTTGGGCCPTWLPRPTGPDTLGPRVPGPTRPGPTRPGPTFPDPTRRGPRDPLTSSGARPF
jgi:hypothetical protein